MKRMYRSETNRKLGGICGGIGEILDVDPTVIRLLAVGLAIATAVVPSVIVYFVGWWIIPAASEVKAQS